MEDTPGNVQPDLKARRAPGPPKRSPRWTLLFVGDHGKTVPVKRFKGLLYLVLVVLLLAIGAAGGLYWVNRQTLTENQRLAAAVEQLRGEISALRYDKDVLTTRLVLTEAQLNKQRPPAPPAPSEPHGGEKAETGPDGQAVAAPGPPDEAGDPPAPADRSGQTAVPVVPSPADESPVSEAGTVSRAISVEDLSVALEQEQSLLRVTFVIRKDDSQPESVSGHAFVVLKPEGEPETGDWIPMPWARIESGRPTPARRGQYFSIARFKPMKFETRSVSDPDRIAQLTVFIFDTRGELILQRDFQIPDSARSRGAGAG